MKRIVLLLLSLALAAPAAAQLKLGGGADNLLEPEKAFRFSARALDASSVEVTFAIADGYYMYRERFKFTADGNPAVRLGAPEFPRGLAHKDEFFGETQVYRKNVRIRLPVEGEGRFDLKVISQGCADVGVCYVPMESGASLQLAAAGAEERPSVSQAPPWVDPVPRYSIFASDLDIQRLFEGNFALLLGGFFLFGLLLAFTPCVLPMIPILSGIIAGEGRDIDKLRALLLSVSYVLGMALAYAAAGVAAAFSGVLLAAALQNVWVLSAFALVFVLLALSMFGFYELQLPGFLHHRLHSAHGRLRGGQVVSVAAMTPSSGKRFFSSATARGTSPLGLNASRPLAVFSFCSIAGNSASTGMSSFKHCSAIGSSLSTVNRWTPGIEATSSVRALPSMMNTG